VGHACAAPDYGVPSGYGAPAGYGTPAGYDPHGYPSGPSSEETTWALLAHLSYFVLGLIAPLIIYLVKKDSPFVRAHAAEAFNMHVTVTIASIVAFVLVFVLIGFLLLPAVLLGGAVLAVIAAVAAGRGEPYRYPLTIHFLS
jgi:uncharacterized Tic20 family protein